MEKCFPLGTCLLTDRPKEDESKEREKKRDRYIKLIKREMIGIEVQTCATYVSGHPVHSHACQFSANALINS
jgi:hypothetical protein